MYLGKYLIEKIDDIIEESKLKIKSNQKSLKVLKQTKLNQANYIVSVTSASYGKKSTATKHTGKLEEAIKKAEEEFKKDNQISDIPGLIDISVNIRLEENEYSIPKDYWYKFTESYQKGVF